MTIVRDIMSKRVVTVTANMTLIEAARHLCENDMGGAPVVEAAGKLVGFIAETALIDLLFDMEARKAVVSDCMSEDANAIHPEDSLAEVARLLALYNVRRLPVVDDDGKLVGIVTCRDLLNHVLQTGDVLADPLTELIPTVAPMT